MSLNEIYALMPSLWNYSTTVWVGSSDMTDGEKVEHADFETTGGYLKKFSYKEMFANGWEQDTDENKLKFFNFPNFDADKFKEITGIDASEDFKRLTK